jgi:hypothetical protein
LASTEAAHDRDKQVVTAEIEDKDLRDAISRFLFFEPERQVGDLGASVSHMVLIGRAAIEQHDYARARIAFEEAAKLALYFRDKKSATDTLELADKVPGQDPKFHEIHQKLLDNMDKAMNEASTYYNEGKVTEQKAEDPGTL